MFFQTCELCAKKQTIIIKKETLMKYILKLAFPLIVMIILAGLLISSMTNPNPVVVVVTVTLITIVLLVQLRKIRKNAKKHYRNAQNSSKSASTSTKSSKSTNSGLTQKQAQAVQNELRRIAQRFSTREQLTSHADIQILVTSNGDGTFTVEHEVIRDGHEESYSSQVDSAEQVVLNDLDWKLADAVKNLKI